MRPSAQFHDLKLLSFLPALACCGGNAHPNHLRIRCRRVALPRSCGRLENPRNSQGVPSVRSIAAADLVAEEMRRRTTLIGRLRHHQSTWGSRAAVPRVWWQPEQVMSFNRRSKPATERMFCNFTPFSDAFFSAPTTSFSLNMGLAVAPSLCLAELRLQFDESIHRCRRDCPGRQKSVRDQNRTTIEFAEMLGVEEPCGEVAPEIVVGQNTVAIDLVFQRRFLE